MNEGYILLVEDNPDDVELTVMALQDSQVVNRIVVARDGVEALEILFGDGGGSGAMTALPTVVLLDLQLPRLSGMEVLSRIRENARTEHLPVVVLTSSKQDEDILSSYRLHANAYVRKPVDFAEFCKMVRTIGLFWVLLNEPPPAAVLPRTARRPT